MQCLLNRTKPFSITSFLTERETVYKLREAPMRKLKTVFRDYLIRYMLNEVAEGKLTHTDVNVFHLLLTHDNKYTIYPKEFCKTCGLSERHVRRTLLTLKRGGYIKPFGPVHNKATAYDLGEAFAGAFARFQLCSREGKPFTYEIRNTLHEIPLSKMHHKESNEEPIGHT